MIDYVGGVSAVRMWACLSAGKQSPIVSG